MTTIKLKNGSGAPTAGDLAQGEPALDLTNKRLYTEDSGGTVIEVGTNPGVDVTFADDRKAIFGAGSDLQIYHDGSNSYISEQGTGNLLLETTGSSVRLVKSPFENMLVANVDGAVQLYYDNAQKLATTSTGIDVTGTVTADGLTLDAGVYKINNTSVGSGSDKWIGSDGGAGVFVNAGASGNFNVYNNNAVARLGVDGSTGDISFYEDTGTTAKLFWDASAESLGIGTTSPSAVVHAKNTTSATQIKISDATNTAELQVAGNGFYLNNPVSAGTFIFRNGTGNTERMRIDSSGNLLVGRTSVGTTGTGHSIRGGDSAVFARAGGEVAIFSRSDSDGEILRFDANGSAGVGSIGSLSGRMAIGSGNTGLYFDSIRQVLTPHTMTGNTYSTTIDLGRSLIPFKDLYLSGKASVDTLQFAQNSSATGATEAVYRPTTGSIAFKANSNEAMRIDSSGNLLVGCTSAGASNGITLHSSGYIQPRTNTGIPAIYADREGSDGSIIELRKDGTAVGSIGVDNSIPYFLRTAGGIAIGNTALLSVDSSGTINDNAYDLGGASNRFKDLHLSGTAHVGNTKIIPTGSGGNFDMTFQTYSGGYFERARITGDGNLLVGTTTTGPGAQSGVAIAGGATSSDVYIRHANGTASGAVYAAFTYNTSQIGSITQNGVSQVLYNTSSDQRLKDNIVDAPSASDDIDAIQVRSFDWKADGSHQKYGMVAQELNSVAPEAVSAPEDPEEMMGVDYSKLVPMLVKEIQSLRARVAQLETN